MSQRTQYSSWELVIIACYHQMKTGKEDVHECDLTVAAWELDRQTFGLKNHEEKYPNHKRVCNVYMGKKNQPMAQGYMRKTRTNYYALTAIGMAKAESLLSVQGTSGSTVSDETLYDSIQPYMEHRAFAVFERDPSQPKSWTYFAAFFNVQDYDKKGVTHSMKKAIHSAEAVLNFMKNKDTDVLRRGPRSKPVYSRQKVEQLQGFINTMISRFDSQIQAICSDD